MWFKLFTINFVVFLIGMACGNIALDNVQAAQTTSNNHDMCFENKIFFEKKNLSTFSPQKFCKEYDRTLSFEQNIQNCDRLMVTFLDI